jgi:hypothetical protein
MLNSQKLRPSRRRLLKGAVALAAYAALPSDAESYWQSVNQVAVGADITTGLKSYWLMNEGAGTTFADGISGHNGTLSGASWGADYVNFTGFGGTYGTVADHADFAAGSTMTVFGWVKSAAAVDQVMVAQYDSGTASRAWSAMSQSSGGSKFRVLVSDDGTSAAGHLKDYVSSITLFDNTFHSWAFRFNAGALDLFVDGTKDASVTKTLDPAITTIFNSTAAVSFGDLLSSGVPGGASLTGGLKKVRFYNTAKTDADIAAMHAVGP